MQEVKVRNKYTGRKFTVTVSVDSAEAAAAHLAKSSPELEIIPDDKKKTEPK